MRIVSIVDYCQPQLGYQDIFLCQELERIGHEVYMVTSDRYSPVVYQQNKHILGQRIKGIGLSKERGVKIWRLKTLFELTDVIWMRGLEKKILELKPDLVIMHGIATFQAVRMGLLKGKLPGCKLIYDDHMTLDNSRKSTRFLYDIFRFTLAPNIRRTGDAFVAICEDTKQFMYSRYGIPLEQIRVIRLAADETLFKFDPIARKEIRKDLGIGDNEVIFIYTGKIIPMRELELLAEAVKLFANSVNTRILIVGSGIESYVKQLQDRIKSWNLQEKFIWHDAVPNEILFKFYSAADVAVWPWGASIGQNEALSCGLPLIIGGNTPVTDLVSYENGYVFKETDAAALAEKMQKLLDPGLRHKMGLNSRKAVEEHFTWRIVAKKFVELIEK